MHGVELFAFYLSVILLAVHLTRIALGAGRAWHAGQPSVAVTSWVTVSVIGLGVSLLSALGGSWGVHALVRAASPNVQAVAQVALALLASHLLTKLYQHRLAKPIGQWFNPGEADNHAG